MFHRLPFGRSAVCVLARWLWCSRGCSWVPTDGPYAHQIRLNATSTDAPAISVDTPAIPYALVKLTPDIVSMVGRYEPRGLAGTFPDKQLPASKIKFGIGDVVSVTIFEAAAGGLFTIPTEAGVRPGNFRHHSRSNRRQ